MQIAAIAMQKGFIILLLFVGIAACSGDASGDATKEATAENKKEEVVNNVTPDYLVEMEIQGMTCVMGCGGDIKDALIATGGVASVEYDFEQNRQPNKAKVLIDSKIVSSEQLEAAVHALVDSESKEKRFNVISMSEEPYTAEEISIRGASGSSDQMSVQPVESSSNWIELPNILDLFTGWFSL